jgi:diacylglycerol kinase (ATP)
LVLAMEALNSAVEQLSDAVDSQPNARIGHAKDYAAAGVLISAIIASVVGLAVFVPRLMSLFQE